MSFHSIPFKLQLTKHTNTITQLPKLLAFYKNQGKNKFIPTLNTNIYFYKGYDHQKQINPE